MADATLTTVLRHVRRLSGGSRDTSPCDDELLHAFLAFRDQDAFAILVRRHGPMVLNVCRRVLHHHQDAEDAFQATFLVLARKAASVRKRPALASWLHGAAYRAALTLKRSLARRRTHEVGIAVPEAADPHADLAWCEVQALLEEEIQRLPEQARTAFVLCCLESQSRAEVARELGVAEATVSNRLDQARRQLQRRLAKRGVTLSAVLAAEALARPIGATVVPPALLAAATRGATGAGSATVGLVDAVLRTTAAARLKVVAALALMLGALAAGAALVEIPTPADPPREDRPRKLDAEARAAPADPLPPGVVARLGTVRLRHGSTVTGLAYTPDGKTLVSASYDGTARVWDAATGREIRRFGPLSGSAYDLAVSADGRMLAVIDYNAVHVGDVQAGRLTRVAMSRLNGHPACVALSPDGKLVAAQGAEDTVVILESATGKRLHECRGHAGKVNRVAFAPDGKALASCGEDGIIRLWDVQTGKETLQLKRAKAVGAVAFSRDGKLLATGDADGRVCLWRMPRGELSFDHHAAPLGITAIAFSPDGASVVASGKGNLIHRIDVVTGKALPRIGANPEVIAISPDGRTLASGGHDSTIRLWDVTTGKERPLEEAGHCGPVRSVAVTPDGTVATCAGDGLIHLWEASTGKLHRRIATRSYVSTLALSPDGKLVTSNHYLWDRATGKELGRFKGTDSYFQVAFSPDGRVVAVGSQYVDARRGGTIGLWDVATLRELKRFGERPVQSLAYSPDGKALATGDQDGAVRLWDVATGREIRKIQGHEREINSVAFSPDGKALASSSFDGALFLWDPATGKPLRPLVRGTGTRPYEVNVLAVAFSPTGKMLATADRLPRAKEADGVTLWEVATGRVRLRLTGHQGFVNALAFARDGRTVVTGSTDTTALAWDVTGPRRLAHAADLLASWNHLSAEDAEQSYRAIGTLATNPEGAAFLAKRLRPVPAADGRPVAQLLRDLDNDAFAVRDAANQELEKLGESAEPALHRALADLTSLEPRRRVERILNKLGPEWVRTRRAIEALELAGTPAARAVLQSLAGGASESRLTREAKAALDSDGRTSEKKK